MSLLNHLDFIAGLILMSFSSGLGLTMSFQGEFLLTTIGVIGTVLGFKLAQKSYSNSSVFEQLDSISLLLFLFGSSIMSAGFVLLASSSRNSLTAVGGLLVIIGYLPAHEGVNRNLI